MATVRRQSGSGGAFGVMFFIFLAVVIVAVICISEMTDQDKQAKQIRGPLKCEIARDRASVVLTNLEDRSLRFSLTLNDRFSTNVQVGPRGERTVSLFDFADTDGKRFNILEFKPLQFDAEIRDEYGSTHELHRNFSELASKS